MLISVLIITTISTFVALSAIGENRLQERIAGNQAKEINARAKAEQGVFDSYQFIKQQQNNDKTLAQIKSLISGQSEVGHYLLSADFGATANTLLITSKGQYHGATAYLKAEVLIENGTAALGNGGAVVACDGVSLTGGGLIDSFDSRNGSYSALSATSNADVVSINGDVGIHGGTNLKGDLTVNGTITQSGSTTIGGDINASKDLNLAQATVHGNVSVGQNATIMGGSIGKLTDPDSGNVNITGNFKLNDSATTTGALNYAGNLTKQYDSYDIAMFSGTVNDASPVAPMMASHKCNEKDIANAMPTTTSGHVKSNLSTAHGGELAQLEFSEMSAQVFDETNTTNELVTVYPTSLTSELWQGSKEVYVFDSVKMKNTMVTITGDVTIMVKGELTTTGGETGFRFNDGDTNSSLTILSEGTVDIGSDTSVFANAVVDSVNKKVPLTIYSSYESKGNNANKNAVFLDGAANMYAKVYAPLGRVEYAASGAMMGALEGKYIDISGAGAIHFDEALKHVGQESSNSQDITKFAAIYYHYPN
ncbi:pilus assembly PilX N-terminal domain-containing protein [Psychromonas sp. psych-6C06]|uniref:pilus assembly PilX N-terminal domain-containing protein n=1 Tax=Psychromonas sp. psych-6C06 TaxID=2058089 RepID=UPI00187BD2DE|nr:pilus assembly PilX N-terminal domain-containing protein [Psychromonas sp. psych-6C06]